MNDHDYCRTRTISARQAGRKHGASSLCPCCTSHDPVSARRPSQKRKRTSRPCNPSAERPAEPVQYPLPQLSNSAQLPSWLPRPRGLREPAERPSETSSLKPLPAALLGDEPLTIFGRAVEEYQQLYHAVVDDILTSKKDGARPYSLKRGRRIKQKLWRLNRPVLTESEDDSGQVHVDVSYGVGVFPPLYDVDVSGEPEPEVPQRKRVKTQEYSLHISS